MKKRETNYDYLRSLSCIAIVLLHVSGSYWSAVDTGTSEFLFMTIYNGLTRFAVPVFMMLSGAFVLDIHKETDMSKCFRRFGKLLLNFYLWSAFFAFQGIGLKLLTGKSVTLELWKNSLERFLWGHYHMWFVFLILGFYLIVPIVRQVVESKKVTEYFLLLWILLRFLIPGLTVWVNLTSVNIWISRLDLNIFVGYLGYFILGYYIRKHGISNNKKWIIYVLGVMGLVYSLVQTVVQSGQLGENVETFYSPSTWNVLFFSIAVFTFFALRRGMHLGERVINKVADYSFIIYMIHPFFLEKLNVIGITTVSFNCLISIPILTLGIFVLSYLSAAILKRIPWVKTWIL